MTIVTTHYRYKRPSRKKPKAAAIEGPIVVTSPDKKRPTLPEHPKPARVIVMRVAVEKDLHVLDVEAERLDVRFDLRRCLREGAIGQDEAVIGNDQERRHVAHSDVVDVIADAERRDRLVRSGEVRWKIRSGDGKSSATA